MKIFKYIKSIFRKQDLQLEKIKTFLLNPSYTSIGESALIFINSEEIIEGNIGFDVDSDGNSLHNDKLENWDKNWIIIGYDTLLINPIIADKSKDLLPIFSSHKDEKSWNLIQIADSIDCFEEILIDLAENKKENIGFRSFDQEVVNQFLNRIKDRSQKIDIKWWNSFFEDEKKKLELKYEKPIDYLEKFKKTTYKPLTLEILNTFSENSKFGGYPYLRDENDWEICPKCQQQMQLFLQLNLGELPNFNKENKTIIQLFNCDEDFEWNLRKIEQNGLSKSTICNIENPFKEKKIINWISSTDYLHQEEYNLLKDHNYTENEFEWLREESDEGFCIRSDKLFGWPYWEQEARYPIDEKTNEKMKLLFQIVSEENLPYMYGDDGIFQLFYNNEDEMHIKTTWSNLWVK